MIQARLTYDADIEIIRQRLSNNYGYYVKVSNGKCTQQAKGMGKQREILGVKRKC